MAVSLVRQRQQVIRDILNDYGLRYGFHICAIKSSIQAFSPAILQLLY